MSYLLSNNRDQGFDFPKMHMLDLLALATIPTTCPACTTAAICSWHVPATAAVGGGFVPKATFGWALSYKETM